MFLSDKAVPLKRHCDSPWEPALTTKSWDFTSWTGQDESFQMMADHGDLCDGQEVSYCMNGGTCYKIPSMNTLSCVCNENYKGSRCEQFQLFSSSANAEEAGLIAAVVIVTLLILVILAVVIYYVRKMLKAKQESQQNNQQPYWRVKPRV